MNSIENQALDYIEQAVVDLVEGSYEDTELSELDILNAKKKLKSGLTALIIEVFQQYLKVELERIHDETK